jgi:hypothetical protein
MLMKITSFFDPVVAAQAMEVAVVRIEGAG